MKWFLILTGLHNCNTINGDTALSVMRYCTNYAFDQRIEMPSEEVCEQIATLNANSQCWATKSTTMKNMPIIPNQSITPYPVPMPLYPNKPLYPTNPNTLVPH